MLVHSFSAMVSCFTFLSEGVRCALGVAIVVGGGSGGFAPSFPERAFFPFLHFYKFGGLHFPSSVFIFLFFPPPPPPFFFFWSASSERQKALLGPYRFDSFTLPPANVIFSFSRFPFSGSCFFPSNSPPWRPFLLPQTYTRGSSARPREPAEPCRNARAHFGAARPSGRRRFHRLPAAFLRFPGGRAAAARSAPEPHAGEPGVRPGIRTALPVGGGPWQCLRPETFLKLLRGTTGLFGAYFGVFW